MDRTDSFLVEGRIAVEALINAGHFTVESILLEKGKHEELRARLSESDIPFQLGSRRELQSEAGYDFHRGVLAKVKRPAPITPTPEELDDKERLVLPLGLADPGNLGTVVRNSVAFGADGIVVEQNNGADIWGRKAIRASATGVFRVPIYELEDVPGFLEHARGRGFLVFGTSLSGGAGPLSEVKPTRKSIVLLGTESHGLSSAVESLCDELIYIPMKQGMDSLNVGSTSAIVCHHLFQG
ncbi:MAG: RNA methyltransferase [Verrucomicrobiota bacterium]